MMGADIFTHTNSNRKRIYALSGFTVQCRVSGWFFKRTDHDEPYKGPYSTETSVTLMISRALCKELKRRDGLPS
jgi:hypothetical protein